MSEETNKSLEEKVPDTCADMAAMLWRLVKVGIKVDAKKTILDADGSLAEDVCMLLMVASSFVQYVDAYAPSTAALSLSRAKGALVQTLGKLLDGDASDTPKEEGDSHD